MQAERKAKKKKRSLIYIRQPWFLFFTTLFSSILSFQFKSLPLNTTQHRRLVITSLAPLSSKAAGHEPKHRHHALTELHWVLDSAADYRQEALWDRAAPAVDRCFRLLAVNY